MTPQEWAGIVTGIHDAYGRDIREGYIDAWFPVLAEFPADVVRAAVALHVQGPRGGFLPNGAELRAACERVTGTHTPTFEEVWAEVTREMSRVGRMEAPAYSDDARALVRALGGWGHACQEGGDPRFVAHARRTHDALTAQRRADRAAAKVRAELGRTTTAGDLPHGGGWGR